jgi:hypothetical protein
MRAHLQQADGADDLLHDAGRHARRVEVRGAVPPQVRDQLPTARNVAARRAKRLCEGACLRARVCVCVCVCVCVRARVCVL